MIDAPTPALWSQLRSSKPVHDDSLTTVFAGRLTDGRNVLFGIDRRSDLHLLIPVDGSVCEEKPADLQGLRVRQRLVDGQIHYLDLSASAAHERLFSPLVEEIMTAVIDHGRAPWKAVNTIMRAWQSAWKPTVSDMSKTLQVGLFGELLTLEKIVLPALGTSAIHFWSGPDYERHDFVGNLLHLEVKTTRKSRHEHEISRFDQLNTPEGRSLLVVSILLEESIAGTETIATKMESVIDLIRSDPEASDLFMSKMIQIGWSDELRRNSQLMRFNIRDAQIYEVDSTFPRLPIDFECPDGVVAIKYTIDLANVPTIGVDDAIDNIV